MDRRSSTTTKYAETVKDWSSYHDLLALSNSQKYGRNVRGTILKYLLFVRARDLVRRVTKEQLQCKNGAVHVVDGILKHDLLSILSEVYSYHSGPKDCRRGNDKAFTNYETVFLSLLSKYKDRGQGM